MLIQLNQSTLRLWLFATLLVAVSALRAGDEASSAAYIKLSKNMVINFGEPSLSRLKYMKIVVQVRLSSSEHMLKVQHHMPALKDALITLFSACEEDLVQGPGGREKIRMMALNEVQKVLKREEGEAMIQDLLFGSFIVQR